MTDTAQVEPTGHVAWVNGTAVSPSEATDAAAALFGSSRAAVVAGMGTDVAGARALVTLAQTIGASIDHMDAGAVFGNLEVMRRAGWIVTTPLQTRARADTVLLVGSGLPEAWPEMVERLGLELTPTLLGGTRRVFHLCPGGTAIGSPVAHPRVTAGRTGGGPGTQDSQGLTRASGDHQAAILPTLAALRGISAGRATSLEEAAAAPLRHLAAELAEARFGVAIWSAATLGTLAIEMLCGLIDDLNKQTRFAGLPLMPRNGAEGVTQVASWMTGFPIRTGFAGPAPLHDPWRFDAQRLITSREADAAIWISAFSSCPPPWDDAVPTIALVPPGTMFRTTPRVVFEVGCPGRDHDAMLFDQALGGLVFAAASAPRAAATVADIVATITTAVASC